MQIVSVSENGETFLHHVACQLLAFCWRNLGDNCAYHLANLKMEIQIKVNLVNNRAGLYNHPQRSPNVLIVWLISPICMARARAQLTSCFQLKLQAGG